MMAIEMRCGVIGESADITGLTAYLLHVVAVVIQDDRRGMKVGT